MQGPRGLSFGNTPAIRIHLFNARRRDFKLPGVQIPVGIAYLTQNWVLERQSHGLHIVEIQPLFKIIDKQFQLTIIGKIKVIKLAADLSCARQAHYNRTAAKDRRLTQIFHKKARNLLGFALDLCNLILPAHGGPVQIIARRSNGYLLQDRPR